MALHSTSLPHMYEENRTSHSFKIRPVADCAYLTESTRWKARNELLLVAIDDAAIVQTNASFH